MGRRRCFGLGRRSYGRPWQHSAKAHRKPEHGVYSYLDHVANAASVDAYRREGSSETLSAETLPENESLLDFATFAREYPDKLFPLLAKLRVEFQELFIEYYLLGKSQSFLAKVHGQIQTRIWQKLRITEQALGALIVLGAKPTEDTLRPILRAAGIENTEYGALSELIVAYARTQSYAEVAEKFAAPIPAIRKIFRPAIKALTASTNLKATTVGSYLRNLTYNASLTRGGLSKRCLARLRRTRTFKFDAPSSNESPLIQYGAVATLGITSWYLFELSSEHRMARVLPLIRKNGKRMFGKTPAQIFAPTDADGELKLGYILARSASPALTRTLTRIRGISDMAARYNDAGSFVNPVLVPDREVQIMIAAHSTQDSVEIALGDFVEVLTGDASRYCGEVTSLRGATVMVKVDFPSGRWFTIRANRDAVRVLEIPAKRRAFWGEKV